MKKLLFILFLILLLAQSSFATDYYVDCNATSGGDGSLDTPWDTIADVNGTSFLGDDNIYFSKGCTWRERLTVPSSGTLEHLITFASYAPEVNSYPQVIGTTASTTYSVTVNGIPVFVEDRGEDRNYTHFSFIDRAIVEITVSENINSYDLSPKSYSIDSTVNATKITFTIDRPRKLILHNVNSLTEKLFIFADAPEESPPHIGDSDVTDITAVKTIDLTGNTDEQVDIQSAIDTLSTGGGGILYFKAGKYKILDSINIKSDVTVYLAPGARIYYPGGTYKYINFNNVSNAAIKGRGSIDGPMVESNNGSTNITIEGVVVMPCAEGWWAVTADYTTNYIAKNVKVINFIVVPYEGTDGNDGFDVDYSNNALVDDCFFYGGDDALVVHANNEGAKPDISGVIFSNCVVWTGGSSCKVGTPTYNSLIENVVFKNIDIVSFGQDAIGIRNANAGTVDNVVFKDIRVEQWLDRDIGSEGVISLRLYSAGQITDVYIQNLTSDISMASTITGYGASNKITGVTIDNYYLNGTLVTDATTGQITTNAYVTNLAYATSTPPVATQVYQDIPAITGWTGDIYTLGDEEITNGTFTTNVTGWSSSNLTLAYEAGPIGGRSNIAKGTATATSFAYMYESGLALTSGLTYRVSYVGYRPSTNTTANSVLTKLTDPSGNSLTVISWTADTWVTDTQDITLTANRDDFASYLAVNGNQSGLTVGDVFYWDDISIKLKTSYQNVWQATLTTEPATVYFDGNLGNKQISLGAVNSEFDWYWASNVLYVYSPYDPDYKTIETEARNYGWNIPCTINAGDIIPSWTDLGDGRYRYTYTDTTAYIVAEDDELILHASDSTLADGYWYIDTANKYIYYKPTSGVPTDHTVTKTTTTHPDGIKIEDKSYITIRDLNILLTVRGVRVNAYGANVTGITLDNLNIQKSRFGASTIIQAASGYTVSYPKVLNSYFENVGESISCNSNNNVEKTQYADISRNIIKNGGITTGTETWDEIIVGDIEGIGVQNLNNSNISENYIEGGCGDGGIVLWTNTSSTSSDNTVTRNEIVGIINHGINFTATNATADIMQGNIISANIIKDITTASTDGIIAGSNDTSDSNKVVNNTVYNCRTSYGTTSVSVGWTFKNNISMNPTLYHIYNTKNPLTATFDNNIYYPDTGTKFYTDSTAKNFADWKTATSQDTNSITSDPLFVNASGGDFRLLSHSPAISKGFTNSATLNLSPDIGAFEYRSFRNIPNYIETNQKRRSIQR